MYAQLKKHLLPITLGLNWADVIPCDSDREHFMAAAVWAFGELG